MVFVVIVPEVDLNLSKKSRIEYINYSLFMFIRDHLYSQDKEQKQTVQRDTPSTCSSSLWSCLVGYELGPKELQYSTLKILFQ